MWKVVLRKEIMEMLKDRRVVVGSFVMPIVVIFMMFQLLGFVENSVTKQQESPFTIVDRGENPAVSEFLKGRKSTTVKSLEEGSKLVTEGKSKLVLDFGTPDPKTGQVTIKAVYDSNEPLSSIMLAAVRQSMNEQNRKISVENLKSKGIQEAELEPFKVDPQDVADTKSKGASGFASLIPYMVILYAFYGGFASVSDMVAGEKERGTLETLLISPVSRLDIALGKFLALGFICLGSAVCGLAGVFLAASSGRAGSAMQGSVSISANAILSSVIALLPLVGMFAALLVLVSTWAKNMRECQTYLTVASFIVLIPAVFSNILGFTDISKMLWIKWVPILSTSIAIRQSILGRPDWTATLGAVVVCTILGAGLLFAAIRMFRKEEILARV